MQKRGILWMAAMAVIAIAVACGTNSEKVVPTSPTSVGTADASADGTTLKVTAPALVSPTGGTQLTDAQPTLKWSVAAGKYVTGTFTYRVQLLSAAGAVLEQATTTLLQWTPTVDMAVSTNYQWKVRAEIGTSFGPWSSTGSFKSMDKVLGYIRGNELYDPLIEGKTVGTIHGAATFIPGAGLRMDAEDSYVEYTLPQALTGGEYSALITNLGIVSSTEDPKDRLFSMREGVASMNDNRYRMTVDNRGNGAMAWRFITGDNSAGAYIETTGTGERAILPMNRALTYFYKATWGGGVFNVLVRQGGYSGAAIYNSGKGYKGTYNPSPHNVYIGSPWVGGDRGEPCTVVGMIIRQVWVSGNPRPGYANQ